MGKKKATPAEAGKGHPTVASYYSVVSKPSEDKNKEEPLETEEEIAFTFYLQTPHCQLENGTELQRRSLDQYHGASSSVWCRSNNNQLVITSDHLFEEMQLIPLGGGSNYWGTDFLLAFPLGKKQNTFSWNIKWS